MSEHVCKACGICCEMYGTTINVSTCDLERWRSEGRDDILTHVGPEGELWVGANTEERLGVCPFYYRDGPDTGGCEIHDTKPRTCRLYPTEHHKWRCVTGATHAP